MSNHRMWRCIDWNEAVPHYGSALISIPRFKTVLDVGSTVSIIDRNNDFRSVSDTRTNLFYGRIINVADTCNNIISLNLMIPFERSHVRKTTQAISYGPLANVREIVQSNIIIHVPLENVIGGAERVLYCNLLRLLFGVL